MYRKAFDDWKTSTNERQKLQWAYAVFAILGLLLAGLIGLVDMYLAQNLLQVVYVLAGLFIANFVAWALIRSFIEDMASDRPASTESESAKTRTRRK